MTAQIYIFNLISRIFVGIYFFLCLDTKEKETKEKEQEKCLMRLPERYAFQECISEDKLRFIF